MTSQITNQFGDPLAGLRLLLVEDEALVAMELQELISSLGAETVGPFGRVADALEALRHEQVNGGVLDVRLDGDTTFQIADVLLQAASPIVFISGAISSIPQRYRQVPRLHKPFDYTEFARLAESIFARR
jgi:CheY-like chemotaxis protein